MRMSERYSRKPSFWKNFGFWSTVGPITLAGGLYCYGMVDFDKLIMSHHLLFAWLMIGVSLTILFLMTRWKIKRRNQW